MRKIFLILLFISILIACTSKGGRVPGTELSSSNESVISTDSSAISVVWPMAAGLDITVGGSDADISGFTSEAIQSAADILFKRGTGGTIVLSTGTYEIFSPVRLYDDVTLTGSGPNTILKKCRGFSSPMAVDADYGELKITVADASGFRKGMGVAIYDDAQRSGWDLTTARITDIEGNTVYIDEYLLRDYRSDKGGMLSNASSVIEAISARNIRITNLTVDGSGETNDMIDGCRAGAIYLHKVHKAIVEDVVVRNFNSDGISWQITEYVTVRNCEVYGCSNSGLHPGTGSPFTLIEGNTSHDNGGYGLYICWRVRDGIVRNNSFHHNVINGISTGHKDTNMLFAGNHIYENGSNGIHLRSETDLNAPHKSIFRDNIIESNGTKEPAYGISINCKAKGVVIESNTFRNSGKGNQRAALLLLENSLDAEMKNNSITEHIEGDLIDRLNK